MPPAQLMIGVLTAANYEARRQAVQRTWGRDLATHPEADLVFLIGDPHSKMPRREGDCLYLPCPDNYECLPQKTRWFCLWALGHTSARWLFKCDDDTYLRIDRLLAALRGGPWSRDVVGCQDGNGDHFHGGAGYLLTRDAALSIAARLDARTGLEDWKARDAVGNGGMWFEHDPRFCFDKSRMPLPMNEGITCHYCPPVRMRLIHDVFLLADIPADAPTTIPRVFHHVWLGGQPIPDRLRRYRETWAEHHPAWKMKLWTEREIASLPLVNQRPFAAARTPAQKCHVARYEILHREGGVYVDFDLECRRPLGDLLPGLAGFAAAEDDDAVGIAILGTTPGSPLLERTIATIGATEIASTDPPQETGSRFFTGHLLADNTWRLFWWSRFYPIHYSGRIEAPVEQAHTIHHWEASWKKS